MRVCRRRRRRSVWSGFALEWKPTVYMAFILFLAIIIPGDVIVACDMHDSCGIIAGR